MRLTANRPLRGAYGRVTTGQQFTAPDSIGHDLIRRGLARLVAAPFVYETKIVTPEAPEVAAGLPFRERDLPDSEPAPPAADGDHVLSSADVPLQSERTGRVRGLRRGRKRAAP